MKLFLFSFFCILSFGCDTDRLEIGKAKTVAEELILAIDKEDYNKVSDCYTPNFNASEPIEERTKKLQLLKNMFGNLKSIQLIDSLNEAKFGEESRIVLTYKITHSKVTSIETFNVVYEEGGYRISGHTVKSENLQN